MNTESSAQQAVLSGHSAPVTAVAFSQDGRHILTGSEDGTARLWEASTGRGIGVMRGARTSIKAVAFNGDGPKQR